MSNWLIVNYPGSRLLAKCDFRPTLLTSLEGKFSFGWRQVSTNEDVLCDVFFIDKSQIPGHFEKFLRNVGRFEGDQ